MADLESEKSAGQPSAAEQQPEDSTVPEDGRGGIHLSCKAFRGQEPHALQEWLAEAGMPNVRVRKKKPWHYAFVTLEDETKLKEQELFFKKAKVQVNARQAAKGAGKKRPAEEDPNGPSKKLKAEEKIPVLKELRERIKGSKKSFDGDALEKSAPLMKWDYKTQLQMKHGYVKTAVRSITKLAQKRCEKLGRAPPSWCSKEWSLASGAPQGCCCPLDPPIGAPEGTLRGWRNKCEFTIGRDPRGEVEVGFILKILPDGAQVIGSIQEVPLVPAPMQRLCAMVSSLVAKSSFPIYDRREGQRKGVWRTLLARVNPSNEMLVMFQTTSLSEEDRANFVEPLLPELEKLGVTSVFLQFNDEVTDAARPTALVTQVHGKPRLEMPMLGLKLEVGPLSFFNPNTTTCRFLMETALAFLNLKKTEILLDIFCGIGTIGLCAAHCCEKVIGVDVVEENIEDARRNAEQNAISNTEFLAGKAEELVPKILGDMDPSKEARSWRGLHAAGFVKKCSAVIGGLCGYSRTFWQVVTFPYRSLRFEPPLMSWVFNIFRRPGQWNSFDGLDLVRLEMFHICLNMLRWGISTTPSSSGDRCVQLALRTPPPPRCSCSDPGRMP
ncbi:unnamed protein product [Durusdinium trenchii]|uniref:Methyltransferase domain-containing protein n=1 Tax=Durusdinium trenchii TaxID=1381693 RepID=A0ABP0LGD7_9DINO